MRLTDWAKQQGIAYLTAWRWYKQGKLPVRSEQMPSGAIMVYPDVDSQSKDNSAWIYCRVSSYEKQADLDRQADRCVQFCQVNGWPVEKVVKEVASGLNDHRPKLLKLLDQQPARVVVEHKDRLTRFGFGYFEHLLPKIGCELVVINRDAEEQEDLLKDWVAVITSFCCRLYGLRRGTRKAKEIKDQLQCDAPSE